MILLVLLLLAFATPATALTPSSDPYMRKYERAALSYWHESPVCGGEVAYYWWSAPRPDARLGEAVPNECRAGFDRPQWTAAGHFVWRCALYLHEWAHMIGYGLDHTRAGVRLDDHALEQFCYWRWAERLKPRRRDRPRTGA